MGGWVGYGQVHQGMRGGGGLLRQPGCQATNHPVHPPCHPASQPSVLSPYLVMGRLGLGIGLGPEAGRVLKRLVCVDEHGGHLGVLRVVLCAKKEQKGQAREQVDRSGMNERGLLTTDRLGHAEQGLQGDEGGLDGQGGGPLVLQDVLFGWGWGWGWGGRGWGEGEGLVLVLLGVGRAGLV